MRASCTPADCVSPNAARRYVRVTQQFYMSRGMPPPAEEFIRNYYRTMRQQMAAGGGGGGADAMGMGMGMGGPMMMGGMMAGPRMM